MVRVVLPFHLQQLAQSERELAVEVSGEVTQRSLIDAIEARFPALRGAIRDQHTQQRRALVRFFACGEDLSHESPDAPLPVAVVCGEEPFIILGAIAGGC